MHRVIEEINGTPATLAVERVIGELRRGRAVVIAHHGAARRVAALETLSPGLMGRLVASSPGKATLLVSEHRANALGLSAFAGVELVVRTLELAALQAAAGLNALLEQYPIQPRVTGHDTNGHACHDWRIHITSRGSAAGSEMMAGAVWGLAVWLCEHGGSRFGVCADPHCGNVYLDTSSNCCRRFCSERCATRSHVAAHRARKRAAVAYA